MNRARLWPYLASISLSALFSSSAQSEALDLVSQVSDLEITVFAELPANTASTTAPVASCPAVLLDPTTAAGRHVATLNWQVTAEVESGELTFVSFVGKVDPGTSGSCLLSDGNIGIFRGVVPQGLVYSAANARRGIGSLQVLEGGRLRIWDDYLSAPLADLQTLDDSLVIVRNVADRDTFCEGTASAPNIFGLPIHVARRLLLAEGWLPATSADRSPSSYIEELRQTLPELQDCSGTGFGFCGWDYVNDQSQRLSVVTAGESDDNSSPGVSGFQINCGDQAK